MSFTSLLYSLRTRVAGTGRRRRAPSRARPSVRLTVKPLEDRTVLSTLTVLSTADSGPGSLRQAILDAGSGDQISFDPSLNGGTITLASELLINKSLDIEGPGAANLTISGNGATRVLDVVNGGPGGVKVELSGLTIADGKAPTGGGLQVEQAAVDLHDCTFSGNQAADGPTSTNEGGAVFNDGGAVVVHNSTFSGNHALGGAGTNGGGGFSLSTPGGNGGNGLGGAIYSAGGSLVVDGSTLDGNSAVGGRGGNGGSILFVGNGAAGGTGGDGLGGAIYAAAGGVELGQDTLSGNQAVGGAGGTGGHGGQSFGNGAAGGAGGTGAGAGLYLTGVLGDVGQSELTGNQALGGNGGNGGNGGLIFSNGGAGGAGGQAAGGGAYLSGATVGFAHSGLDQNEAVGGTGGQGGRGNLISIGIPRKAGNGGPGGNGLGGGLFSLNSVVALTHSGLTGDQAVGGNGGAGGSQFQGNGGSGGDGLGGGLYTDGSTVVVDFTAFSDDQAIGGAGGAPGVGGHAGAAGQGIGGAIYIASGAVTLGKHTTFDNDFASTSDPDVFGTPTP